MDARTVEKRRLGAQQRLKTAFGIIGSRPASPATTALMALMALTVLL